MAGLTISWTCQVVSLRWQTNWRAGRLLCPRAREKRSPGKDDGSFSFHLVLRTNGTTSQGLLSQHKPLGIFYKYSCLFDISLQSYLHGIFHLASLKQTLPWLTYSHPWDILWLDFHVSFEKCFKKVYFLDVHTFISVGAQIKDWIK